MNFFNKLFSGFSSEVVTKQSNLQLILEAIIDAKKSGKECVTVIVTSTDYSLPIKPDVEIRSKMYEEANVRIDYNYQLMVQLESLGYYAATRAGNSTDQLFSSLFIMVV